MDPIKLVSKENMDNPMEFSIRERSINVAEMDIDIDEVMVLPGDGDIRFYWSDSDDTEDFWTRYREEVQSIAEEIEEDVRGLSEDENFLDGREWCKEHGIPENVFTTAVNQIENVEWGVSPMYPYRVLGDEDE